MRVYIGIGSNIGNKEKNIENAIVSLKEKCSIEKISSLYETEPVGFKKQDWFFNCVAAIDTNLKPIELLNFLQSVEKKLGRAKTVKNGPRTVDLDILFYGNEIINNERLIVPHPRLHERLFVLMPLKEIAPNLMHPLFNQTISYILDDMESSDKVTKIHQSSYFNTLSNKVFFPFYFFNLVNK